MTSATGVPDSDLQFDADMTRNEIAALEVIFTTEIADEAMPILFVIKDIHGFLGTGQRGLTLRSPAGYEISPPGLRRAAITWFFFLRL